MFAVVGVQATTGASSFGVMLLPLKSHCRCELTQHDVACLAFNIYVKLKQEHKLGVRHLLLQRDALPLLWTTSDDKTVKIWAASDAACSSGSAPASISTITLPCVALVCETVEVRSAAGTVEDIRSVWMGCDDHVIRIWSCKRQQLSGELKYHKVFSVVNHHLHHSKSYCVSGLGDGAVLCRQQRIQCIC